MCCKLYSDKKLTYDIGGEYDKFYREVKNFMMNIF